MTKILEGALRKGSRAASTALPKGDRTSLYRPAEITFPVLPRREKTLPPTGGIGDSHGAEMTVAALSDALMLESLRYGRYLEVQASE